MFPFIESNCHCINWICSFQALSTTALLRSKANWWLGSQLVQQRFRCNCLSKWLWRYADSGTFKGAEVLFLNMASYNIVHQHWTRDWQHQRSLTRLRQYWWGEQKTWQKKSLFILHGLILNPMMQGKGFNFWWELGQKLFLQSLRWQFWSVWLCSFSWCVTSSNDVFGLVF